MIYSVSSIQQSDSVIKPNWVNVHLHTEKSKASILAPGCVERKYNVCCTLPSKENGSSGSKGVNSQRLSGRGFKRRCEGRAAEDLISSYTRLNFEKHQLSDFSWSGVLCSQSAVFIWWVFVLHKFNLIILQGPRNSVILLIDQFIV